MSKYRQILLLQAILQTVQIVYTITKNTAVIRW